MKISAVNNNNYKTSHKAVNQKLLKQAIELNKKYGENPPIGHLLQNINIYLMYKTISKQDAIETLKEIKKYAKNAKNAIDDTIDTISKWKD